VGTESLPEYGNITRVGELKQQTGLDGDDWLDWTGSDYNNWLLLSASMGPSDAKIQLF
jgi:hypothetical protein